jgi:pimeloyl-ACP methyl ester carboxylesterase
MIFPLDPLTLSSQGQPLIFSHANGYPPLAYRSYLNSFRDSYQIKAVYLRPFWPGSDPDSLRSWRIFRDDYLEALPGLLSNAANGSNQVIGMGHSLGAVTTLLAAIQAPENFRALVLIEPTIFPFWQRLTMRLLGPIRVFRILHPLIRRTLRRKTSFPDRESMFQNYRKKNIFQKIPDQVLWDYVDGLSQKNPAGTLTIKYPPPWEARIYETGGSVDRFVLRNAGRVSCPVLVLRGEESDTLAPGIAARLVERLPDGKLTTVPAQGHLLPLEAPERTANMVQEFLERI